VLEELSDRGCLGVFSTHLHGLLDMEWDHRLLRLAMETAEADPPTCSDDASANGSVGGGNVRSAAVYPTHKLLVGADSRVSLAFEVAASKGIPRAVLARALEIYTKVGSEVASSNANGNISSFGDGGNGGSCGNGGAGGDGAGGAGKEKQGNWLSNATATEKTLLNTHSRPPPHARPRGPAAATKDAVADALKRVLGEELVGDNTSFRQRAPAPVPFATDSHGVEVSEISRLDSPGAGLLGCSVVYALLSREGAIKVGETDDLTTRLRTHMGPTKSQWVVALVAKVPVGGKSAAREAETRLMGQLRARGLPLAGEADARHRSFGGGSGGD
jgi:predicted GIY-YIG superfamily endonuclease